MNINDWKRTSFPFEEWMKEVHASKYHGTDDDMSEAFDDWLGSLDGEEYLGYANTFGNELIKLIP